MMQKSPFIAAFGLAAICVSAPTLAQNAPDAAWMAQLSPEGREAYCFTTHMAKLRDEDFPQPEDAQIAAYDQRIERLQKQENADQTQLLKQVIKLNKEQTPFVEAAEKRRQEQKEAKVEAICKAELAPKAAKSPAKKAQPKR